MTYYAKNDKVIKVYHSHITISPYKLGENERLERMLSIWIDAEYRFDPIGYYIDENTHILYVPRGINIAMLEKEFNSTAYIIKECIEPDRFTKVKMTVPPRDRIQVESIDFLSGFDDHRDAFKYGQQALILDTGDGKTYTTVHAIVNYKMKACIITHQDKIKQQWIDTFLSKTNMPSDMLINVSGSGNIWDVINGNLVGNIYFVNHQTITSFAKQYGWPTVEKFFSAAKVGIKVFDEAHLNFKNVLHIDFFSDTFKTFYLTANFGRTDTKEGYLYKRAFSNVIKFGEETKNYKEKRKHIVYIPVLYRSNPNTNALYSVMNAYGFSVLNFSKYALHDDINKTQLRNFFKILEMALKFEGKILITVPKIDDTEFIKESIEKMYPFLNKKIGTINSKNSKEYNDEVKTDYDIICSTIKSCGTGVDIKKLRCIINMEPFSSNIVANQLSGRLREYAPDKDTYFFDLIDTAFPSCENQYRAKLYNLRKKCKEVKVMRI